MSSYWKSFRLIFVVFSLYLLGDVFYRWDGFSHYAPFSKFVPSSALISILWSLTAFLITTFVWVLYKAIEWLFNRAGWKITIDHILQYSGVLGLLVSIFWIVKLLLLADFHSYLFKLIVFFCLSIAAAILSWLLRKQAERWLGIIQESITPLVWLFGVVVIMAVPLVVYHTWFKEADIKVHKQTSSQPAIEENRPNFILVTFDALTACNMSSYGYNRETTPFISEWAKSATMFKRIVASSNATVPTLTSFMTGKRVWSHASYFSEGFSTQENNHNLAQILKNNGYYNRIYIGNRLTTPKALGMESAYDFVSKVEAFRSLSFSVLGIIDELLHRFFVDKIPLYNWIIKEDFLLHKILWVSASGSSKVYLPPERAFNDFIESIEKGEIPEPYFVWFHFYPPHDAYLPPSPYMGMFNASPELRSEKSQDMAEQYLSREYAKNAEETLSMVQTCNALRDRYDESILYCDKQYGDFMKRLDGRNISTNAVIILSSDHGESFNHGYITHGSTELYEHVTHIPLFIKEPDQTRGYIVHDLIEQIDITASILDLANIPVPSWMEGRSFAPLMRGNKLSHKPAFSMNLDRNRSRQEITHGTIAVWEGDYKLVHYLDKNRSLLFNPKIDPDELVNLFDEKAEVSQHLLSLIHENLEKANEIISSRE